MESSDDAPAVSAPSSWAARPAGYAEEIHVTDEMRVALARRFWASIRARALWAVAIIVGIGTLNLIAFGVSIVGLVFPVMFGSIVAVLVFVRTFDTWAARYERSFTCVYGPLLLARPLPFTRSSVPCQVALADGTVLDVDKAARTILEAAARPARPGDITPRTPRIGSRGQPELVIDDAVSIRTGTVLIEVRDSQGRVIYC